MSCESYTQAGAVSSEQRGFRQGKASLLFAVRFPTAVGSESSPPGHRRLWKLTLNS